MPKKKSKYKSSSGKSRGRGKKNNSSDSNKTVEHNDVDQSKFAHYFAVIITKMIDGRELYLQDIYQLERSFALIENNIGKIKKQLQSSLVSLSFTEDKMNIFLKRSIALLEVTAGEAVSENISARADQYDQFSAVNLFAEIIWILLHAESRRIDFIPKSFSNILSTSHDVSARARKALSATKITIISKMIKIFRKIISQDCLFLSQSYDKSTSLYGMVLSADSTTLKNFILVYLTNAALSELSISNEKTYVAVKLQIDCLKHLAVGAYDSKTSVDYKISNKSQFAEINQISFFCHNNSLGMCEADLYYFPASEDNFAANIRIETEHNSAERKCVCNIYFCFYASAALFSVLSDDQYNVEFDLCPEGEGDDDQFNEQSLKFAVTGGDLVFLLVGERYLDAIDIYKSAVIMNLYEWLMTCKFQLVDCIDKFAEFAACLEEAVGLRVVSKPDLESLNSTHTALFSEARQISAEDASLTCGLMEKNNEISSAVN